MTRHLKIVANAHYDPIGDVKNMFYFRTEGNGIPDGDAIVARFYTPLRTWLSAAFILQDFAHHEWEGPADGIWWDTQNNKPKKAAPWGTGQPFSPTSEFTGGDLEGGPLPPQMAAVIYAKTNVRHVIARKFYGGLSENYGAQGVPITAFHDALASVAAAWLTNLHSGQNDYTAEVWGPKYGFTPLTSSSVSPVLGTQRKRKAGVGS